MKIAEMSPRYPVLSYIELEAWVRDYGALIKGARVDRVFVPEFLAHPEGYFKRAWVLDLHAEKASFQLFISLRSQECGLFLLPPKTLRPARTASRSGFDLSLGKFLAGNRIQDLRCVKGDRVVLMRFGQQNPLELHLHLIPARPAGVLLENQQMIQASDQRTEYTLPEPRELSLEQIKKIPNRPELIESVSTHAKLWMDALQSECLLLRFKRAAQKLKTESSSIESKLHSLQEQKIQTELEPDWNYFGSLLQTHFYQKPEIKDAHYSIMDYENGETILIPADPKLGLKGQLERYFHLAKRKKRRVVDSGERILALLNRLKIFSTLQAELANLSTLPDLEKVEAALGLDQSGKPTLQNKDQKKVSLFSGKQYRSKEGLTILVGRNLSENLELTFKIARGNDLWLHVKGKPGSHTVVLLPPKRTASLDTLLDAAQLCILHSGGKDWGKTDVDYTARKNVKKIKNQSEVSYSQNKTLSVTLEEDRIKRLYENEI